MFQVCRTYKIYKMYNIPKICLNKNISLAINFQTTRNNFRPQKCSSKAKTSLFSTKQLIKALAKGLIFKPAFHPLG